MKILTVLKRISVLFHYLTCMLSSCDKGNISRRDNIVHLTRGIHSTGNVYQEIYSILPFTLQTSYLFPAVGFVLSNPHVNIDISANVRMLLLKLHSDAQKPGKPFQCPHQMLSFSFPALPAVPVPLSAGLPNLLQPNHTYTLILWLLSYTY